MHIEARDYVDPVVTRLVSEVQDEYVQLYGGPDEAVVEPGEFTPPDGLFLVGFVDGAAVTMGGWRRVEHPSGERVAEIKRMYVVRAARGRGLSRLMLAELERTANEAGFTRFVLNTGDQQPEAIRLYETSGYESTDPFGRYACTPGAVFFGKQLTDLDAVVNP